MITEFCPKHRPKEFIALLNTLDGKVPPGLHVYGVLDNRDVHPAARTQAWLRRHPRFHFHFTPMSSSWASMVEGGLGHLEQHAPSRGSFKSVPELKHATLDFTESSNSVAKPWTWTKDAPEIGRKIEKLRRRVFGPVIDPATGARMGYLSETPHYRRRRA